MGFNSGFKGLNNNLENNFGTEVHKLLSLFSYINSDKMSVMKATFVLNLPILIDRKPLLEI